MQHDLKEVLLEAEVGEDSKKALTEGHEAGQVQHSTRGQMMQL